jgi:hypothetical protein
MAPKAKYHFKRPLFPEGFEESYESDWLSFSPKVLTF